MQALHLFFKRTILTVLGLVLLNSAALFAVDAKEGVEAVYDGLEWRFIGPYRGGRVLAVSGVVGDPLTYYMGAAGGGVWKTTNAGVSWKNISDKDFGVGTIGAIGVAQSDPNVVYVGTGESPIRGVTTSRGDGVYRSLDAGETWQHMGLTETRQTSALVVHPTDPDTVYIAAQGNPWGPNDERGIYKSTNGGASWQHVLKVDADTGAADLVMDPNNPRILYAAMWNHGRNPWFVKSGDESGGVFKSIDGGDTWEELTSGLPRLVGKIGIAVAPSNSNKVYAIIEAEEGGLFVSNDGGKSWSRKNKTRLIQARSWYYNHINVDPLDENTLYVLNAPLLKSIDGGTSFSPMRAPHGDHHDMWFNPSDGNNFINANDGGAAVTFDGGKTWSSIYNQPTAQFYRVATDNLQPYTVYGGQQDNSAISVKSDAFDGSIGRDDYGPIGGGESAHVAFDADNPRFIYATTINATLTEYDTLLKRTRVIKPYPEYVFGRNASEHKYRTNWNAPVVVSQHDPSVIYYGTQILLKSEDRGVNWEEISPDLTKNDKSKQGLGGGPITNEQAGAEFYNTIFYIKESQHEQDVIWVGSDDGLLHLTRDGGASWNNVTPKNVGEAHINAIEVSPHDPATAYIAVTAYKLDDHNPYIYVTRNYGELWKRIDRGLPENAFVRVVREDPERKGLLYAGTEAGVFVSFDDGADRWKHLDLNMPPVPVTDLKVRQNDLVAATQGRAFWILDDLHVVQQMDEDLSREALHLFTPEPAIRQAGGAGNPGSGDPEAQAKTRGARISYYISPEMAEGGPLSIEVMNENGDIVRRFSSDVTEIDECRVANADPRSPLTIRKPNMKAGLNTWVWNLRSSELYCAEGVNVFAGFSGPRVVPGEYTVRVMVGEAVSEQPLRISVDPRTGSDASNYVELQDYTARTVDMFNAIVRSIEVARTARDQLELQARLHASHDAGQQVVQLTDAAIQDIDAWLETVTQPRHKTFEDDVNWPNMLDVQVRHLIDALDGGDVPVTAGSKERFNDLQSLWQERKQALAAIGAGSIAAVNDMLSGAGATIIPLP